MATRELLRRASYRVNPAANYSQPTLGGIGKNATALELITSFA
jgi:hypothetical protein